MAGSALLEDTHAAGGFSHTADTGDDIGSWRRNSRLD